jgi:CHAT domain-containing protein/Tfp pilus assembly protein PilF
MARTILTGLASLFFLCAFPALTGQGISPKEFGEELTSAISRNDEQLATSLIKFHRLLVKPFVNQAITVSIKNDLAGSQNEAAESLSIAEKTAEIFENTFGERSLTIGVNYLKNWNADQKGKKVVADSLYALGTSIRGKSENREEAIGYYKNALGLYESIGDERGEAEILGGLGLIYTFPPVDYPVAVPYYKQALIKRIKVDDRVLTGNTLNSLGSIYYEYFKDYPVALSYLEKAVNIRTEIGDSVSLARTIHVKAAVHDHLGEKDQAIENYKLSYILNSKVNDKARMAEALMNLGTICNDLGRYTQALDYLKDALQLSLELDNPKSIIDAHNQSGFVLTKLGDYDQALTHLNEALAIANGQNDESELAGIYNNLGILYQDAGRPDKAIEFYKNAIKIYEEKGDKESALAPLNNIGTIYFESKEYARAEEYHARGLIFSRDTHSGELEAYCLLNLANDQDMQGKLDEALANYQEAMKLAFVLNNPDLSWMIYAGMAENYEARGDFEKVVAYNDTALKIIENLRNTIQNNEQKASYMAAERNAFEDVINLLCLLYEKDPAKGFDTVSFQYAENSKSRAFLDLLAESAARVSEGSDTILMKQQAELQSALTRDLKLLKQESLKEKPDSMQIASLRNSIKRAEAELGNLKIDLRKSNPRYADLKYPVPVSIKQAEALCPDKNTVLLEYSVGDSSSCLWVITSHGHRLVRLPGRKVLKDQVESLRFALMDPSGSNKEFIIKSGSALYTELVRPAEPFLTKKSKIIIVPDDILNYLPFEVLLTSEIPESKTVKYSDIPFLIKKYPVSYVQSSSVLHTLLSEQSQGKAHTNGEKELIAFGDPDFKNQSAPGVGADVGITRLEFSGKEVEGIASLFGKGMADTYLREKATEENFKHNKALKDYSFVHFATHGIVDEKNPDRSCLVLAKNEGSGEDGLLSVPEIFNLKLGADLVVLSACRTGLGKLVRGEGMIGLTRAFMYAGSPSVAVSLWSVSDISTARLMTEFYKNMIKEDLIKTDALREAQLTLLKDEKYAHPFYWAPFILFGDWK